MIERRLENRQLRREASLGIQSPHGGILAWAILPLSYSPSRGGRIELRGFGALSVNQRAARNGRNPRTGAHVSVEQKYAPLFKISKEMRERLNRVTLFVVCNTGSMELRKILCKVA
jgi:hypothetical protein